MDSARDLRVARKIAKGSATVIKGYVDETRRQGRIIGDLTIVVKDGGKERRMPYLPTA
jgi:hypothetical protein